MQVEFLYVFVSLATAARSLLPLGEEASHAFLLPCRHASPSSLLSPNASVGEISVPARDGNILSVCGKCFRWRNFFSSPRGKHPQCLRQTLLLRGSIVTAKFHWYKSQRIPRHFSLQSSMKCDVYIRKELYAISRCQVARSCSAAVPNTPRPAAVPNTPPDVTSCRRRSMRM